MGSQKVIERISLINKSTKGQKECMQSENTNKRGVEMRQLSESESLDFFEKEMELEVLKMEYLNEIMGIGFKLGRGKTADEAKRQRRILTIKRRRHARRNNSI